MAESDRIGIGYDYTVRLMQCQIRTVFFKRHTVTFQQNGRAPFSTDGEPQRFEEIFVFRLCKDPHTIAARIKNHTDKMRYQRGGSTCTTRFVRHGKTFYYIAVQTSASYKIVIRIKQTDKIPDSSVKPETVIRQKVFDTFRDTGMVQIKFPDFHIITLR
jgi:hypothetical protein